MDLHLDMTAKAQFMQASVGVALLVLYAGFAGLSWAVNKINGYRHR